MAAAGAGTAITGLIEDSSGASVDTPYQLAGRQQVLLPCPSGQVHQAGDHTVWVATTVREKGGCQIRGCPYFQAYSCRFLETGAGKGGRLQACLACGLNGQPTSGTGSAVRVFPNRRCKLCRAQVPDEE